VTTPATHRSIATTFALVAFLGTPLSHAQGALKPVEALIVNPPSRPVPVAVVVPPTRATAVCKLDLTVLAVQSPVYTIVGNLPVEALQCPPSVSRLDVHRIVLDMAAPNAVHYSVFISLAANGAAGALPVAALSDGTPDLTLNKPVRLDRTVSGAFAYFGRCSSGVATVSTACGGSVYFVGTPAD
jgi:hypothetical protein